MKITLSSFFVVFLGVVLLSSPLLCQQGMAQSSPNPPNRFALTNARIVTASGADIERGTIIIRDGLIVSVGAGNVQVPVDVRLIDATGLTIYPGIIDAGAATGIPAPRPQQQQTTPGGAPNIAQFLQQQQQSAQQQSNSAYPAGLQPEISAVDLIRMSDTSIETARNSGFTTVLVVPRERIFQGQSALINLAGETAGEAIVRAPAALHLTFQPLQVGQFPTSLMGSFAAVRQMFLDAQQLQEAQRNYERNPRGVRRPDANKSLEALFPYLARTPQERANQRPIVFQANTEREIGRVLNFVREFNLKAIIAGGTESGRFAEQLKALDIPVLLSLNFPRRTSSTSPEADPESLTVLRSRVEAPKTAARLAAAGVRFAFQSGGMSNFADFWTNAGRAVNAGLARPAAIRAMTLNGAEILGVADRMGSIEPGKIANLTVVRGDIFDRARAVTHVFVDGRMYEIPAGASTSAGGAGPANAAAAQAIAGKWNLTMQLGGNTVQATLTLTPQRNQLAGQFESTLGNAPISQGEVTAEGFRFVVKLTVGEQVDAIFAGRINENQMNGTVTTPQGTSSFTGTKTP